MRRVSPASIDSQLDSARSNLAAMEARYTDDHPDVKKLKETIASLEKLKKDMANEARDQPGVRADQPQAVQQGNAMLQPEDPDEAEQDGAWTRSRSRCSGGCRRPGLPGALNATPAVEAQMSDMMRDFGNLKKEYQDLLGKKTESALATSLERQQQGAQFRVIDPPSLPDKPNFPDRFKFSLGAIGAGIALAILFGFRRRVPGRPHPRRSGSGGRHQPAYPG